MRHIIVTMTVLGALAAPSHASAAVPTKAELGKYSRLHHQCKRLDRCEPGRNVRRAGVRHVWVSSDGKRRHAYVRDATARRLAREIRGLRRKIDYPPGWVIPAYIVMRESRGTNHPPNGAGASGYYQIIPGTWAAMGGLRFAPAAYLATKREQDVIARRIWNSGGPSQWDCA